ncbi:MAG: hypothetical protein KDK91_22620 [Gammaproteobacteria bacterium]|nr:hypothetical protein [Gammaproteobacteria bacterium]
MKTKVTVTIDEKLVPVAKRYARAQGVSLSQLIENVLRELSADRQSPFSERWGGRFQAADRSDPRYDALAKKYL